MDEQKVNETLDGDRHTIQEELVSEEDIKAAKHKIHVHIVTGVLLIISVIACVFFAFNLYYSSVSWASSLRAQELEIDSLEKEVVRLEEKIEHYQSIQQISYSSEEATQAISQLMVFVGGYESEEEYSESRLAFLEYLGYNVDEDVLELLFPADMTDSPAKVELTNEATFVEEFESYGVCLCVFPREEVSKNVMLYFSMSDSDKVSSLNSYENIANPG